MKRNVLLPVFCLLLIGLSIQACKKSKPHATIDAGMKAAFNYLPGTYWVYKDSITGVIDSFAVAANTGIITYSDEDHSIDYIDIYLTEYNSLQPDSINWIWGLKNNIISLEWDMKFKHGYMIYFPLFEYPVKMGYVSSDKGMITNIFTSYNVSGQSFPNVAEIDQASKFYHPTDGYEYDDWFYVSADAGIIKMRLNHPQDSINRVWEIQRYHIVK